MTWLALADINEFEILWQGNYYSVMCPEHGHFHKENGRNPVKLKNIFRAIDDHVTEQHKDSDGQRV